MIAENLIQYLQHPEELRRVSYQELKTLALEYPYFPHVHQLLLFKSRLADHKDFSANLSRAAAHSVDRSYLRRRIQELDAILHRETVHEEFFELKPLAELEQRLSVSKEPIPAQMPKPKAPAQKSVINSGSPSMNMEQSITSSPEALAAVIAPEPPTEALAPVAENMPSLVPEPAQTVPSIPEPMDKATFRSWKRRHTIHLYDAPVPAMYPQEQSDETVKATTAQKPEPEYNLPDLRDMAERSVEEKDEVVSESLAALMARQGHVAKAIEMYVRLSLHFPEKSAYFAAQIENLKNN